MLVKYLSITLLYKFAKFLFLTCKSSKKAAYNFLNVSLSDVNPIRGWLQNSAAAHSIKRATRFRK